MFRKINFLMSYGKIRFGSCPRSVATSPVVGHDLDVWVRNQVLVHHRKTSEIFSKEVKPTTSPILDNAHDCVKHHWRVVPTVWRHPLAKYAVLQSNTMTARNISVTKAYSAPGSQFRSLVWAYLTSPNELGQGMEKNWRCIEWRKQDVNVLMDV
jgi:hypothetical protein